jgi:nitroreductase
MDESKLADEVRNYRKNEHSADPLFLDRWSPRAMSGEAIAKPELFKLFEAARWAPSAFNSQPWRVLYAMRGTKNWDLFFDLLSAGNKTWVKNAGALIVILSQEISDYNGKPLNTHSYDAGAAWENLALQGTLMGIVVHGMSGFDYVRAKKELAVPDGFAVEAMAAIGRRGRLEDLPEEARARELPSDRKKVGEFAFEGKFPGR